ADAVPLGSLAERFADTVRAFPDAEAVRCDDLAWSYRQLDARANQLAHWLVRHGVGSDVPVALCLQRSLDMVAALLAITKAGGVYVPIDPMYPRDRIAYILRDCRAPIVLSDTASVALLPHEACATPSTPSDLAAAAPTDSTSALPSAPSDLAAAPSDFIGATPVAPSNPVVAALRVLLVDRDWPVTEDTCAPAATAGPHHLAYIMYTSGTTGNPKGVCLPHWNLLRLFSATQHWFGFDHRDAWPLFHSYGFDLSAWEMWGAFLHGGRLVVVPQLVARSPELFHDLLRRHRITVLTQTPSAFRNLLAADAQAPRADSLRLLVFAGEALVLESLRPWIDRYGDDRPQLINMYGITETTVHVTYRRISRTDVDAGKGSVIGCPIPDQRLFILDDHGELAALGVPGEIFVGDEGLARGYLGKPELTAERFVPDPFSGHPGARLYRSGDQARHLGGGDVEYLGRLDHQVKIRGFRVELGEIETRLMTHPGIAQCVVVTRDDTGDRRLVAYYTHASADESTGAATAAAAATDAATTGAATAGAATTAAAAAAAIDPAQLRAHLKDHLPDYMVPAAFVALPGFPLTANGKIDRKALPAPEPAVDHLPEAGAPRSPVEAALADIWRDVLRLPRVGVHDNFFALGGHSLIATQVTSRIRSTLRVELLVRALFEAPTIAELAVHLDGAARERAAGRIQPSAPAAEASSSSAQQRLWVLDRLEPSGTAYTIPITLRLRGPLASDVFAAAVDALVARHDALRSTFVEQDGEIRARLHPPPAGVLRRTVLAATGDPAAAFATALDDELAAPFDLERG
ncbi:MAG TPA: amino acid adenylation domain-containing protein, partial [Kofleriaceae bacterium]|nr:amino acid adenylation domain-containing protein [Kofleriaceae bacterium]